MTSGEGQTIRRRLGGQGLAFRQFFMVCALCLPGALAPAAKAQSWILAPAQRLELPVRPDGNNATFWAEGAFHVFTSTGQPLMISTGGNQFSGWESKPVDVSAVAHVPLWMEGAHRVNGVLFGWYHHEPGGVCGSAPLTSPKIGAAVSWDNGLSFTDLGIVLDSAFPLDCNARNGFFAGGHGDFSVVSDRLREYFYFFFTNYSGPKEEQGICAARVSWADRFEPAGKVWKFHQGEWKEPGLGGRCTPIFPARVEWQRDETDSFWGPSVHYNTYLRRYVMLLNRSCCSPGWPQEGIYISFSSGPLESNQWTQPVKLLHRKQIGFQPGYYPQVIGMQYGETDTLAGQRARLYVSGISDWVITFFRSPSAAPPALTAPGTEFPGPGQWQ